MTQKVNNNHLMTISHERSMSNEYTMSHANQNSSLCA